MRRDDALAALEWLIEMGADEIVGSEPVDKFAVETPSSRRKPGPIEPAQPSRIQPSGTNLMGPGFRRDDGQRSGDAVNDANVIATQCQTLDDIAAALARFDACPLQRTATNLVLCDGNPRARVMCVGEAPGRDEDIQGKPFVGRSGQLLDRMLQAIGLSRDAEEPGTSVFITNTIFWRPPGNRTPTEQETLMCLPFVRRIIELLAPEFIVCVGATPTQRLTGRSDGILKLRGKWFDFDVAGRRVPLLATLHPAYLLRQPAQKRLAWRDLLLLRQAIDAHQPS